MPDLRALLAALGGGAESLGSDIGQRDQLALVRKRQAALDAMQRLQIFDKLGLSDVPQGQDPNALVQKQNDYNDMVSGVGTAIPNSAGPVEGPGPAAYGKVRTYQLPDAQGNLQTVIQNPAQTPEARQTRLEDNKQLAEQRRQESLAADRTTVANAETRRKSAAGYNTFKALFPDDQLSQQDLTPDQIQSYDWQGAIKDKQASRALDAAAAREDARLAAQRPAAERNLDPLSDEGIKQAAKRAAAIAATKPKVLTPDQVKMQSVADEVDRAANELTTYAGGANDSKVARTVASIGSHIPLVGNAISGAVDEDYQNAMNNARVVATAALEHLPKSRFQPASIEEMVKQLAPNVGDAPAKRASKLAYIKTIQKAIRKRAENPNDLPDPTDLSDAPLPPGRP